MLADTVQTLQAETLGVWKRFLRAGDTVALLDFPSYQNAGDTLIYLGEREYLRRIGVKIRYLTDHARYRRSDLETRHPDGTILIRGGGNLGDRWPNMQEFRERVVRDFPNRRIIQLPQSMDFSSETGRQSAAAAFATHSDLTLMLRDMVSLDQAKALFPKSEVVFSPDAAIGIGERKDIHVGKSRLVKILREDSERAPVGLNRLPGASLDWGLAGTGQLCWKAARIPQSISRRVPQLRQALYRPTLAGFSIQARLNFQQARSAIGLGEVVVTDRLHAAVLATLAGKTTYVADNAYGKISRIYDAYLHRFPNLHMITSKSDVDALVDEFRG